MLGRLSLRVQIAVPLMLTAALALVLAWSGWQGLADLSANARGVSGALNPATSEVLNADRDLYQAAVALRDYVHMRSAGQATDKARADFDENLGQARDRMLSARQRVEGLGVPLDPQHRFDDAFRRWKADADRVFVLADEGDIAGAYALMQGAEGQQFGALREQYNQLGEAIDARSNELAAEIEAEADFRETVSIVLALIALAIAGLAVLVVPGIIVRAFQNLEQVVARLAEVGGDLTGRLPVDGDNEIARLAKRVNAFIAYLQDLVGQAQQDSVVIRERVERLLSNANRSGECAAQQHEYVEQAVTAVHQMQQAIQEIAGSAVNASEQSSHAKQEVGLSSEAIRTAITQVNSLSTDMQQVVQVIGALEEESRRIVAVLDVIGGIADQTNLLA
ncbi:MAG: methyl-accepting chemotaxis protein, partial [Gammaproteobacteria bacterium]|nr:methyl-accepting chemotaxis protein [Gammaproteobacteria bacterium]